MENKNRAAVIFQTHITFSRISTLRLVSHGVSKLLLCFLLHFREVSHGMTDGAAITEQGCGCPAAQVDASYLSWGEPSGGHQAVQGRSPQLQHTSSTGFHF